MNKAVRWDRLKRLMEKEKNLLIQFGKVTEILQDHLHKREWIPMETALRHIYELTEKIRVLEHRRQVLADKIDGGGNSSLQQLLAKSDPEKREEFQALGQELKALYQRMQVQIQTLGSYAQSRAKLGREVLEEIVPETRGKIYNNQGRSSALGRDALLLSHQR